MLVPSGCMRVLLLFFFVAIYVSCMLLCSRRCMRVSPSTCVCLYMYFASLRVYLSTCMRTFPSRCTRRSFPRVCACVLPIVWSYTFLRGCAHILLVCARIRLSFYAGIFFYQCLDSAAVTSFYVYERRSFYLYVRTSFYLHACILLLVCANTPLLVCSVMFYLLGRMLL